MLVNTMYSKMTKIKSEPTNLVIKVNKVIIFQQELKMEVFCPQYGYLHAAVWLKAAAKGRLQSPTLLVAVAPWYFHTLAVHS
jgi:hypothetical protein